MNTAPALLFYLLLLILPIAALVSRRMPLRTLAWMGGAWVAIFGILFLLIANFT